MCCSPWGRKESDTTERLTELNQGSNSHPLQWKQRVLISRLPRKSLDISFLCLFIHHFRIKKNKLSIKKKKNRQLSFLNKMTGYNDDRLWFSP